MTMPCDDRQTSGWPIDLTRAVPLGGSQFPEIHGQGTGTPSDCGVGIWNGQAVIMTGAAIMGTGWPITLTRGFGVIGAALPMWVQVTVELTVARKPGIT
jgi:hypothetical protein